MPRNPHAQQCSARSKRSGRRCRKFTILGGSTCHMHGSGGRLARQRAGERFVERRIRREMDRLGIPVHTDAAAALIGQVYESAGNLAYLRSLVQDLSETPEPGRESLFGPDHAGDLVPHVLIKLYNEERDRLARIAKLALEVGVSERRIRIAEQQGALIADAINKTLDDPRLELSEDQRQLGRSVIATHLRALSVVEGIPTEE